MTFFPTGLSRIIVFNWHCLLPFCPCCKLARFLSDVLNNIGIQKWFFFYIKSCLIIPYITKDFCQISDIAFLFVRYMCLLCPLSAFVHIISSVIRMYINRSLVKPIIIVITDCVSYMAQHLLCNNRLIYSQGYVVFIWQVVWFSSDDVRVNDIFSLSVISYRKWDKISKRKSYDDMVRNFLFVILNNRITFPLTICFNYLQWCFIET